MKQVWDKPNPVKKSQALSAAQKAKARARARSAGRPYPNMVDNIWAARNEETVLEGKAATVLFRAGNKKRAKLNSMSDEERRAYDREQQEKQRKRDDARLEREREKLASKKGVSEAKEADYGGEYQNMVKRVGEKAKQGKMKTIWVANKYGTGGRYKVVPVDHKEPTKEERMLKSLKQTTENVSEAVHPDSLHVEPVKVNGQTKYHVHHVGKNFEGGINKGERLSDTELDDFQEMGGKVVHVKPKTVKEDIQTRASSVIELLKTIKESAVSPEEHARNVEHYGKRAAELLRAHRDTYAKSQEQAKAGDKETAAKTQERSSRMHKAFMKAKDLHLRNPERAEASRQRIMSGISDYYKSKKSGEYTGDSLDITLTMDAPYLGEAKATYCGRCGTTHVAPKDGGKCPALKEHKLSDILEAGKRGRPSKKDVESKAHDREEEDDYGPDKGPEANQNLHNQLKRAMDAHDMKGGADVTFENGKTHFVKSEHAKKVVHAIEKLKPADRGEVVNHMYKSHDNFKAVHSMLK